MCVLGEKDRGVVARDRRDRRRDYPERLCMYVWWVHYNQCPYSCSHFVHSCCDKSTGSSTTAPAPSLDFSSQCMACGMAK